MEKLRRVLARNPSLASVPLAVVHGRVVTYAEMLRLLELGDPEAVRVAYEKGFDPPDEVTKLLAMEFWSKKLPPNAKVFVLGYSMLSKEEILRHISAGDSVGRYFIQMYERLVQESLR